MRGSSFYAFGFMKKLKAIGALSTVFFVSITSQILIHQINQIVHSLTLGFRVGILYTHVLNLFHCAAEWMLPATNFSILWSYEPNSNRKISYIQEPFSLYWETSVQVSESINLSYVWFYLLMHLLLWRSGKPWAHSQQCCLVLPGFLQPKYLNPS